MKLFLPVTITLSAIIVFVVAAPNAEPSSLAQDQQVQDAENQEAVDSAEVNVATPTVISKEDLSKATLDKKAPTVPLGAGVALPVKAIIAKKSRHANTKAKSKSKSPKTSASEKVPTKAGPPVNVKTSAKIGTESEQTIPATEDENPATLEPEPKPATPVDVKTTDLFLPATVELTADEGITQQRKAEEKTAPAKVDMTSKVEILEVTEATKGKSDTEQSGQVEPSPQPTEDKPTPKQPAEDKPTPKQPAEDKPTPKQPAEDKSIPVHPTNVKPTPDQPPFKPTPEQPPFKPTPEQPAKAKPTPKQPVEDKPTPKQPAKSKPTPKQPANTKPTSKEPTKQPAEDKPTPKQPAEDKPTPKQPTNTKPTSKEPAKQPAEDKPTPKQPPKGKPTPKQPAEDKPTPKQPANTKPTPKQPAKQPAEHKPTKHPAKGKPTPRQPVKVEPALKQPVKGVGTTKASTTKPIPHPIEKKPVPPLAVAQISKHEKDKAKLPAKKQPVTHPKAIPAEYNQAFDDGSEDDKSMSPHTKVGLVSVVIIVLAITSTVVGVWYRKISLNQQRYRYHSLLTDNDEEFSVFNRTAYHSIDAGSYDSWKEHNY